MLKSFSDKAIMTKALSMYGKRITNEQYMELMHKKTVAEIAAYLRDTAGYSEALSGVQPTAIHRGQLEILLRKERFSRYLRLMHYDNAQRDSYYHYLIMEIEIEQILQMIQLLNSNRAEEYITQYPAFLERSTRVNLMELAKVRSYDGLLHVLGDTPYGKLLLQCRPLGGELIDYTKCEVVLMSYYYQHVEDIIDHSFHGKTRLHLHEIFQTHLELLNISNIYRLKKYFPETKPEQIAKCILPVWKRIPQKELDRLIAAPSAEEFLKDIAASPYAKFVGSDDFTYIEYTANCINYYMCRRYLRFATDAPTVFTAYMALCRIELNNITTIIEGVRYGVPPSEIKKMLIL
ncbi:V-type ATPase subunit [Hydrogenoanaerobacterium sp.]|uniref:V-type ATPase subunit n=1 Tax=Hydrogenoanaerobacterium sp. TaxID=2953763 RepID=UPI00289CE8F5|nr:V-type ATPase subunit [Hydrogenoanaerobacterium sp.]